jgi:autotransporter-associated beta strand protein
MNPNYFMRRIVPAFWCVAAALFFAQSTRAADLGITVSPSGVMLKDGKPFRSIGGNDPFDSWQWFETDNTHYLQTFAEMKASGINTVRLSAKGWYAAWKISSLSITDKAAYFAKMDAIVDAAAQNDVGVILLLFWWPSAVSDYYGEPEIAATIPGSKTYTAMAQFATDMAEHYKNNPAVVGFDVINEMNLSPDLPNSGQSVTGRWTSEGLQVMYANLFTAIRAVDPNRLLSTGGTDARGDQFHFTNYCVWNLDTPAQMTHENEIANPDPVDVLGFHYYPDSKNGVTANWAVYNALVLKSRKPFYAGEFGNGDTSSSSTVTTANFNIALSELMANRVPLMSDWFMGSPQYTGDTVSPTGTDAWMWNAIAQANAQYEYSWKSLAGTGGDWNSAGSWASGSVPTTADDAYIPTNASTTGTLSVTSTAYARNLAVGTGSTGDIAATIDINGAGQLVLGQNSSLTFATTTDGTNATTITVNGAHGQLLDNSSRSAVLIARQNAGETKPAIIANTVSAYQMKTGDRANISGSTGQLNLFDGLYVGQAGAGSTATVYQSGGIVRAGLDANVVGGTPAGLVLGSSTPKYVLTGGTLSASGITGITGAVVDWQGGAISTLDGASMTIAPVLDLQLNSSGTHSLNVSDSDQTITVNSATTISGAGSLTKSGPGKLLLLGASSQYTYSGTTNILDGILQVKNAGALPNWSTAGNVTVGARTESVNGDGIVTAGMLVLNVGGSGEWSASNVSTILGSSGPIAFGDGSALGIDTSNASASGLTITTKITGGMGIAVLGSGTVTLNPSQNNTFGGMTSVLGGKLQLGTTSKTIITGSSGFYVQSGTLDLGGKSITFSGAFQATTANPNPAYSWAPFLTQPSRVTFAGGTVQNGTITNNTSGTGFDNIYDGQSGVVSANLAGSVGLWKTTPGTLTLSGNNSYTGGTRVVKGTLILGSATALGNTAYIQFMNGTLKYATGVTTDYSPLFQNSYAAINIDTNGQTITFASPISSTNASGLKKSGSGTLILTSTTSSYTGGIWIDSGTLQATSNGSLSGTTVNDLTICNGGTFDLNGTTQTIGNLYSMGSGAVSIVNNKSGTQATLTLSGSNTGQFNNILADHSTGTGTLALLKNGPGMLTLAGVNTFTGPTTVSNGSLKLASPSGPAINDSLTVNYGTWLLLTVDNQFGANCTLNLNGEMVLQNTNQTVPVLTGGGIVENDHLYSGLGVVSSGTATLTVNNNVADTFSGYIRDNAAGNGKMAFIKTGTGTLVFTGNSTYTGTTTISAGTLQLGDGTNGHDGAINSSAAIVDNATLAYNLFGNVAHYPAISGSGNVTKDGPGTLVMAANNIYSGTTTINSGTLTLMGSSGWALNGSRAGNEVVVNSGATLAPYYSHQFGFTGILANITVNSGGTFDGSAGHVIGRLALNGNALVFSTNSNGLLLTGGLVSYTGSGSQAATVAQNLYLGDVPNNAVNATVSVTGANPAGDLIISGSISSPAGASLTKTGNGTLKLSGVNTYSGTTTVSSGNLRLASASGSAISGNLSTVYGVYLDLNAANQFGSGCALDINGEMMLNNTSQTVAGLTGYGNIQNDHLYGPSGAGSTGTATLTVNNSSDTAFNGVLRDNGAGNGMLALIKTGIGTLTLNNSSTYTGSTTVNAGKLKVIGSLNAGSAVTVNSTATLMGTGAVNGPVTVTAGGTIAPGASAGTLIVGSAAISGIYACEINGALADRITSTGSIMINAGATLAFSTLSAPTLKSYILASYSGSLTGTFTDITGTPSGYGVVYDATLKQIRLDQFVFNSWLSDHGLSGAAAAFNADPDHDGLPNGLEIVLGGEPNPANAGSNSAALLPTVSGSSGNLIFTFKRKIVSESAVTLLFQWSTDLTFLSPANDVPVGASSSATNGVTVNITQGVPDSQTDTIVITVPAAKAAGGKLFGRLKALQAQ